jgi:hypothetical protein
VESACHELDAKTASGNLRDALRGHVERAEKNVRARHLLSKPNDEQLTDEPSIARHSRGCASKKIKKAFTSAPMGPSGFRDGRAGQWKEVLTPAQVQRIVDAHGEQMQRFGYLPL